MDRVNYYIGSRKQKGYEDFYVCIGVTPDNKLERDEYCYYPEGKVKFPTAADVKAGGMELELYDDTLL